MPLDPNKLSVALARLSSQPSADYVATGRAWSKAYADYASDATSLGGGSPLALDVARLALAAKIAATFAVSRAAPQTAAQLSAALTSFWLAPPAVFSSVPPGAVTAVGGASVLSQALAGVWAANQATRADFDQAARRMALVLDAFTRSVIVTTPLVPTPIVGPIL